VVDPIRDILDHPRGLEHSFETLEGIGAEIVLRIVIRRFVPGKEPMLVVEGRVPSEEHHRIPLHTLARR